LTLKEDEFDAPIAFETVMELEEKDAHGLN